MSTYMGTNQPSDTPLPEALEKELRCRIRYEFRRLLQAQKGTRFPDPRDADGRARGQALLDRLMLLRWRIGVRRREAQR